MCNSTFNTAFFPSLGRSLSSLRLVCMLLSSIPSFPSICEVNLGLLIVWGKIDLLKDVLGKLKDGNDALLSKDASLEPGEKEKTKPFPSCKVYPRFPRGDP